MSFFSLVQSFLVKLIVFIIISPVIGYVALEIVQNLEKARKLVGKKKWIALSIAGFLIAVLLGWLQ
ncbi:MAG: hypothetical protein HY860_01280 [Chlamydiales bacterium]|nr:hypothetical protein [Chlamydiales bacterium]